MPPCVSIIIPTYNRAADLQRAISSVRAQTFTDWELIVVDNHSTDNTDAVIASMDDPRISLHKIHNQGVIAASRNMGVTKAQGAFSAFLDSDDWWLPEKLERSVRAFDGGADVVYHDLFLVRREGQKHFRAGGSTRSLKKPVAQDLLENGNALPNSGTMVRTALLRQIGALSENQDLVGVEDFDGWLRLAQITDRFVMLNEVLGYYWAGGGNMTNPQRSRRGLDALQILHQKKLSSINDGSGPDWLNYMRGRADFALGDYAGASKALGKLALTRQPLETALKIAYMRLRAAISMQSRRPGG